MAQWKSVGARPHDHQHAEEAHQHRRPAAQANMFAEQRHGERADPERQSEIDRRRLRQLQVGDGGEVAGGRAEQEKPAQHLQPGVARLRQAHAV
jgi:hypothetical protein